MSCCTEIDTNLYQRGYHVLSHKAELRPISHIEATALLTLFATTNQVQTAIADKDGEVANGETDMKEDTTEERTG